MLAFTSLQIFIFILHMTFSFLSKRPSYVKTGLDKKETLSHAGSELENRVLKLVDALACDNSQTYLPSGFSYQQYLNDT